MPKPNEFEYEGRTFRIVFQHDRSRDLAAHELHSVAIVRDKHDKPAVVCETCGFLRLLPLSKKVRRSTRCSIQVKKMGGWQPVADGTSRLNVKAGDVFCRRDGREASLVDALRGTDVTFIERVLNFFFDNSHSLFVSTYSRFLVEGRTSPDLKNEIRLRLERVKA